MTDAATIQRARGVRGALQPGTVRASWPDPEDANPLRREARQIDGRRRFDAVAALHRQNPETWTELHVAAVVRLRRDREVGIDGAQAGGGRGMVEAPSPDGRMVGRIDAATAYREATEAMGTAGAYDVWLLAFRNWTLGEIASHHGVATKRASGRVEAALTRLVEHYGLDRRNGGECNL